MKTTININNQAVEIELTAEQVEAIKKASEKITDRVKSYADACNVLGIDELTLEDFEFLERDDQHGFADHQLTIIARALNEGWEPDWTDSNEAKYYPWFKVVSPGAGFSFDGYYFDSSSSVVGSRLVFKSRELAEYAGKQFTSIYNHFLTL